MVGREAIPGILRRVEIFKGIRDEDLQRIAEISREMDCIGDEMIFHQGEEGGDLYIVERGEIDIVIGTRDQDVKSGETVATMRRGQAFGAVALVDDAGRSATAVCRRADTRLLVIPRRDLMSLCGQHPALGFTLMRNLAADLATIIRERTDRHLPNWMT